MFEAKSMAEFTANTMRKPRNGCLHFSASAHFSVSTMTISVIYEDVTISYNYMFYTREKNMAIRNQ